MVIVEGPDGAGKTTLVNQLMEKYNFHLGERGAKNRDDLYKVTKPDTYRALALALSPDPQPIYVWDRLYWSDFIYAPIQNRQPAFTHYDRRRIEGMIHLFRIPQILCLPSLDVVTENAQKEHQMEGVNDNLPKIWHGYDRLRIRMDNRLTYDYTSDPFEDVEAHINYYLKLRKDREW